MKSPNTQYTRIELQPSTYNEYGLPRSIAPGDLTKCAGMMKGVTDKENSTRQEIRYAKDYADKEGTKVYAKSSTGWFWIGVEL